MDKKTARNFLIADGVLILINMGMFTFSMYQVFGSEEVGTGVYYGLLAALFFWLMTRASGRFGEHLWDYQNSER